MKKINKREKGAALINVLLIVLLAIAIGLPLLYLVVGNFIFRAFDNNVRAMSYRNEIGMDNVYAIIQEIVLTNANDAKNRTKIEVDGEVKEEQNIYKAWTSDGRVIYEAGLDGILGTEDDISREPEDESEYEDLLREYKYRESIITEEQYNDNEFDSNFKYLDITDGAIRTDAVREAYNILFKEYYRGYMDNGGIEIPVRGSLNNELKNRAISNYNMKLALNGNEEQYAIATSNYNKYSGGVETSLKAIVSYRGLNNATERYIDSEVSATFKIGIPDFDSASSISQTTVQISNPLLDSGNALIIGERIIVAEGKKLTIIGNAMVDNNTLKTKQNDSESIASDDRQTVQLSRASSIEIDGRLSVNGDIRLDSGYNNSDRTKIISTGDVLCNEIRILGPNTITNINKLYISDDMEIGFNNTAINLATLLAFNDIQLNEQELQGLTSDNSIGDNSSAILFNSSGIEDLTFDVDDAYIFGTSFVSGTTYKTGESMAVKGNYRVYQIPLEGDVKFDPLKIDFRNYGGLSFAYKFKDDDEQGIIGDLLSNEDKAEYFSKVVSGNLLSVDIISSITNITNMRYSSGMWFNNNVWNSPIGGENIAMGTNAGKAFEKYTKYFGYGEGNQYRLIGGEIPTVIGENGWIDSTKLSEAAGEYGSFNSSDEIIVLVSDEDITLNASHNNKKGIIIAGGNIIVNEDIKFEGTIICGGSLIVNDNFEIDNNNDIAISKIIESAVSSENKALFNLFRDDTSGNLYTYSTIDTQIASINMNELIKIADWKKSKFDI